MLDHKTRYLQLAFNGSLREALRIIPTLPKNERILIEAGTPFIKREGLQGISALVSAWRGVVVADLKTSDGACEEVLLASRAGAKAATVLGSSSVETLNLFIKTCKEENLISMVDMLGVSEPLKVLRHLKSPPNVVILHKGRDEESTRGKVIQYKHVNKVKSKFDVLISAAGGVDLAQARSAIFNGANIVVVNLVEEDSGLKGISLSQDVSQIALQFLKTIQ